MSYLSVHADPRCPRNHHRIDRSERDALDGGQRLRPAALPLVDMTDQELPVRAQQHRQVTVQFTTGEGRLMLDEVIQNLLTQGKLIVD